MRAYNLIELFRFITEDLEMYFQRKRLSLAFDKPQNLHLAVRCFGRTASSVSQHPIIIDEKNSSKFHVPSRDDKSNIIYTVDCTLGTCTCPQEVNGNACPHQAAVALKFGLKKHQLCSSNSKGEIQPSCWKAAQTSTETKRRIMMNSKYYFQCPTYKKAILRKAMTTASMHLKRPICQMMRYQLTKSLSFTNKSPKMLSTSSEQVTLTSGSATINTWLCIGESFESEGDKLQLLPLLLPMQSLEKRGVEIICQYYITAPRLTVKHAEPEIWCSIELGLPFIRLWPDWQARRLALLIFQKALHQIFKRWSSQSVQVIEQFCLGLIQISYISSTRF